MGEYPEEHKKNVCDLLHTEVLSAGVGDYLEPGSGWSFLHVLYSGYARSFLIRTGSMLASCIMVRPARRSTEPRNMGRNHYFFWHLLKLCAEIFRHRDSTQLLDKSSRLREDFSED
ncbi:hypothetical protein WMY93_008361 [Mugilogobius chulae]|uniref:Uncharacterized protein n=1 Tax=Mugilogobius chulae TaxID=88201 RepID=A0AAW0PFR3_9GOBI